MRGPEMMSICGVVLLMPLCVCVCAFVSLCAQANDGEGKQKTKDASKLPKNMRNIFTIVLVVVDLVLIRCHSPIQNYEMMKIVKIHIQL